MSKITLYHGSMYREVTPRFGLGDDKHDYGKGFYLTETLELAKEWSVCLPTAKNGWVHQYELDTDGLRIFDFSSQNVLSWLAELMKHRDADDSKRYKVLSRKFIEKYAIPTDEYDVIKGWRADASYFYIAKAFVRDQVDLDILEELLSLGGLGIQYCVKTEKAYAGLKENESGIQYVDFEEFNSKYIERDNAARENMFRIINSDRNQVTKVFSTLL